MRPKIGLALSGGAARGIAHLGILQAIEELEIEISALSGTSSGAIVAAFYASGMPPRDVLQIIKETKLVKFVRPAISKTGLLKVEKLETLFSRHLPSSSFQELTKKLTVTATDINRGESRYFDTGALVLPILASCCMPVIFDPVVIEGVSYVDGGILNNLPVEPLKAECDVIIGAHCNPVDRDFKVTNAKALMERTFLMAIRNNTLERQQWCDYFIEPPALAKYIGFDVDKSEELFQIGYDYVKQHSEDLLRAVEQQ